MIKTAPHITVSLISYPDLTLFYTFPWPWEIWVRDYCFTSDVRHKKYEMLVYTLPELLARFF